MAGVPLGSFGFKVLVNSKEGTLGCFQEVSGLSASVNVTDLVVGGMNDRTKKLLGNATYSNVTLKRGLCDSTMFAWINDVIRGGVIERKTITIKMLDEEGNDAAVCKLKEAVPVKWDGPTLGVMQDGIATESLELAHEGLTFELIPKKSK